MFMLVRLHTCNDVSCIVYDTVRGGGVGVGVVVFETIVPSGEIC